MIEGSLCEEKMLVTYKTGNEVLAKQKTYFDSLTLERSLEQFSWLGGPIFLRTAASFFQLLKS